MLFKIGDRLMRWGRPFRKLLLYFVFFYQRFISGILPQACRFIPSCSNYAAEILQTQPLFKGLALITWRLVRCQPLCKAGFDPAPPPVDILDSYKEKNNDETEK